MDYAINVVCGACKGEQSMVCKGMPRAQVVLLAGLLDGSAYPYPPGPEASIGRCGVCRGELAATVRDIADTLPPEAAP